MSKVVVSDSSCLIGLSKIGELDILHQLFGKLLIPEMVYHEVVVLGKGKAGADDVKQADWIEQCTVQNTLAVKALRLSLGAGESEAIIFAIEQHADFIILDDLKARQMAEELVLPVIGTVAILHKAAEKGILREEIQTVFKTLRHAGFRFLL